MPQSSVAFAAENLVALKGQRVVLKIVDTFRFNRFFETRPSGSRVIFVLRAEEGILTRGAGVNTRRSFIQIFPAESPFLTQ
jgi:hypothetical protein